MDTTAERVAKNDAAFRTANEQIEQRAAEAAMETVPFICECADESCTAIVRLALGEYEQIRANGRWFLVLPGHEANDSHAEAVRRDDRYVVVEKTGEAAALVEQLHPRDPEISR